MDSKRVVQAETAQITKSGAFAVRSHDGTVPEVGVVNINILGCDIEIAAHDEVVEFFLRKAVPEPPIPMQLIFVRRRANALTIRRVNREHAQLAEGRFDHGRLRIDYLIAERRPNLVPP